MRAQKPSEERKVEKIIERELNHGGHGEHGEIGSESQSVHVDVGVPESAG